MTVIELREKLSKLDDKANVVVQWEHDGGLELFEIDEVSLSRGTPKRIDGKAAFEFERSGAVEWAFIAIDLA